MPNATGQPVVFISYAHESDVFDLNDIEHELTDAQLMARSQGEIAAFRSRLSDGTSIARERA